MLHGELRDGEREENILRERKERETSEGRERERYGKMAEKK